MPATNRVKVGFHSRRGRQREKRQSIPGILTRRHECFYVVGKVRDAPRENKAAPEPAETAAPSGGRFGQARLAPLLRDSPATSKVTRAMLATRPTDVAPAVPRTQRVK
jgi:hypothetical protein